MNTATLKQILLEELAGYTGAGLNDFAYLTSNEAHGIYSIIDIAKIRNQRIVSTVLVARLVSKQIIIELDHHDKTLEDALLARGVTSEQILCAYRGDAVPA